uniref:WEB family protein, chloroplastic n=1 Tax=Noccaea caerulescens TaxID=107243 RepID=A0A1J3H8Z3_NOCCA
MASKTKTSLSETTPPPGKSSPATPRVAKLSRAVKKSEPNSASPTPSSRLSLDRSSPNSKPSVERRSPKVPTPPEETQARVVVKGSETQTTRLTQIKEDLKKANERISSLEKEKAKALDQLKEAKKEAEEASGKLDDALKAQKIVEENSEIEKFQAVEAGIEAVQRNEEELKKELESVKNQHASDSAALRSVTQELEKVNEELAAANDAKSKALSQAADSSNKAQVHAEKVEILTSELTRLKALLDSTREKKDISGSEMVAKLEEEIVVLKIDLEKARSFEAEVKEQEKIIEKLSVDLEAAKMAESCAHSSSEEWKSKAKELEEQLEEANKLERSASVSLESVMKQLQGSNDKLHDTESEIADLKGKIVTLETTIARQKEDLEESEKRLGNAEEELSKIEKEVENLKNELETAEEEKNRALNKEKDASLSVQRLLEQRKKLLADLESSKEEEEKSKKAMESLASALHEVSSEGRELKEKLLSQGDHEYETQIEDLKLVIKATNEKYENMLDEAKHEIDVLVSAVEETKKHFESSKTDWEMKEANLVNYVKKMEEEVASMGKEMNRLDNLLKRTEEEADAAWKKEAQTKDSLKEVEEEVVYLQVTLGEAKAESMKLKESLLDKETEFQSAIHENEDLRAKEDVSVKKIEELSKLLEEAILAKKKAEEEDVELSESEKDYDLLPKVVEFSSENGHRSVEEKSPKVETIDHETPQEQISNGNGNGNGVEEKDTNGKPEAKVEKNEKKEESPDDDDKDDSVEVIFKMWESCQIEKKEAFPEKKSELESQEEEEEDSSKMDESDKTSTENIEETGNALTADDQLAMEKKIKKKKTLLGKVGNLLKKKAPAPVNQK